MTNFDFFLSSPDFASFVEAAADKMMTSIQEHKQTFNGGHL